MTANELADELAFKHIAGDDNGAFSSKIITMLRQQQAEIEALKLRELTDEEILFLYAEHINEYFGIDTIGFARAILKKASEK